MKSAPFVNGDEMFDVLRTCCTRSTPASIGSNVDSGILSATFSSVSPDSLTLDIDAEVGQFRVDCPCYIVFFQDQASYLLTTTIREHPGPSQISLDVPNQMSMERRLSFRLPLTKGLHVTVIKGDDALQAEPKGLSLSGVSIRFESESDPMLTAGECIQLQLRLDHECAELQGSVIRRVGKAYSIAFSHVAPGKDDNPPNELQRVYWKLREETLRSQIIKPEHVASEQTLSVPVPGQHNPSM